MHAVNVSDLEMELRALLTSAGSHAGIEQHAPSLTRLAATARLRGELDPDGVPIANGRQLLLAGIEWLRQTSGRSADQRHRDQHALSRFGEAAALLFGDDAASMGKEKRYGAVAELIGSSKDVPITGKRFSERVYAHLAAAIIKRVATETPANIEPRFAAPLDEAAQRLLERAKRPEELLRLAHSRHLLRSEPWLTSLSGALTASLVDVGADAARFASLDALTSEYDAWERMTVQLLLFEAAQQLGIVWSNGGRLLSAIASPEYSRTLPAPATYLRARASLLLFKWQIERVGTGVDPHSAVPNLVMVPIGAQAPGRAISKYPITIQQFNAVMDGGADNQARDLTLPVTSVNVAEAREFCRRFHDVATKAGQFPSGEGLVPSGGRTGWTAQLPTKADIASCLEDRQFPWSGSVDDSVALARRRSSERLIPVGMFPDEQTPSGVSDLGGLIWQWLDTVWPDASGPERNMVHGGGFGMNKRFLRSDCFLAADGTTRRPDRGFRIVVEC